MNQVQGISAAFFAFSLLLFFIFLFARRNEFPRRRDRGEAHISPRFINKKNTILPRRFLLLSWGVYVSGTLLILLLSYFRDGIKLPLIFICETLILLIGGGSAALMFALSKGLKAAADTSEQDKTSEDKKEE